MLPRRPTVELRQDPTYFKDELIPEIIHIEGYIERVDKASKQAIFKLTPCSINALIQYHRAVHCLDGEADESKRTHAAEIHKLFMQSIHHFSHSASVLEEMEADGTGELPCKESEDVKVRIWRLAFSVWPAGWTRRE
ncbi:hypothetical protein JX265_013962 [Neoarthrinium moseri]|uniref:Uncharacterized protein n=1 Tax=Neoarthrinium moseri TaxID=1658444 RepID=A0A9Q0AH46_9PEZI|nr:uncharacterized protein JN550_013901 [Neoarthrinium moseri]KAI1839422.1 hypothetical protein JX266_014367 [Neoarthrinium moseri]KAI1847295.1 hypothetical protein JX265_013983 [Neoarthrinium moseri]KAI1847470.1 hypothetical protein JX265_013962 [Neoarthrinium moseri]KAI1856178.1 hypothetical protein JN550_013901 [Neoarthrinium moseri]